MNYFTEEDIKELKKLQFIEATKEMNIGTLLKIGERIAGNDFAVRFYYKKHHPKFHLNKRKLLKAVRRGYHNTDLENRMEAHKIVRDAEILLFDKHCV